MLIHQEKDQLVVCVVRNMWQNAFLEPIVAMVCVKGGDMVKYCPNVKGKVKGNSQNQSSDLSSEVQKRNHFYTLKARGE